MHLGEAQDVARLDIPMHPAAGVQLLELLGDMCQSLHTCRCVLCPFCAWEETASLGAGRGQLQGRVARTSTTVAVCGITFLRQSCRLSPRSSTTNAGKT